MEKRRRAQRRWTSPSQAPYTSEAERKQIIEIANEARFATITNGPTLADEEIYIASESTFYRTLRVKEQQHHCRRSIQPAKRLPESHLATLPNQVWTWDITWLPGPIKGQYDHLYLILDIFSRKAVGTEVWESEESSYAEEWIKRAIIQEKIQGNPLVLHSDNGSHLSSVIRKTGNTEFLFKTSR